MAPDWPCQLLSARCALPGRRLCLAPKPAPAPPLPTSAGSSLAAEVQRQLSHRRAAGAAGAPFHKPVPPLVPPQRDLLGRRRGPSAHPLPGYASGGSATGASSAGSGDLSHAFPPLSARGSGCAALPVPVPARISQPGGALRSALSTPVCTQAGRQAGTPSRCARCRPVPQVVCQWRRLRLGAPSSYAAVGAAADAARPHAGPLAPAPRLCRRGQHGCHGWSSSGVCRRRRGGRRRRRGRRPQRHAGAAAASQRHLVSLSGDFCWLAVQPTASPHPPTHPPTDGLFCHLLLATSVHTLLLHSTRRKRRAACWLACRQTAVAQGHLCRLCRPRQDRDTSWQHTPIKPLRITVAGAPRLARTSASLAASAATSETGSRGDAMSPSRSSGAPAVAAGLGTVPSMAPASVLLSRTHSGPAPSSLGGSAKLGGGSLAQRQRVLQRLSFTGSVRGGSCQGAGKRAPQPGRVVRSLRSVPGCCRRRSLRLHA